MLIRRIVLSVAAVAAAGTVSAQQRAAAPAAFRTPQEAVRYYENLVGRLAQQVRSMQDENAMLTASNADLKQRVMRMETEVRSLSDEVAALRKQIAADAEVRKSQLNQLNRLADKLSAPAPVPARTERKNDPPQGTDEAPEYIEHIVEKGTTLNALAKAYHVSVKEIMAANKMKKPVLYAGQKLMIPAPKKP